MLVMPERRIERLDQPQDHAQRDRIQADERLVVDQQLRIHDDRPRQRHAARHAAGQLRGHQIRRAAQADRLQLHEYQLAQQRFRQIACARAAERRRSRTPTGRSAARRSGTACRRAGAARTAARAAVARRPRRTRVTRARARPRSAPMSSRSSVVLPVPLGPITAVICPRRTVQVQAVEYAAAADRVAQHRATSTTASAVGRHAPIRRPAAPSRP